MSTWFDAASHRFIADAYAVKGQWAGRYLAPPTARQLELLEDLGIDPWRRDRWGEVRWVRAFKRSVFHELNWYGGVSELRQRPNLGAGQPGWHAPVRGEWQTGARVMRAGWPARRWAIRLAIHQGGGAASAAGKRKTPADRRWIDDQGRPTARQSLPPATADGREANAWVER